MDDTECQFHIWWSMYMFVYTCWINKDTYRNGKGKRNHYRPEASEKDGRKIISDRLEFYDYYRPFLNNQKVTVAYRSFWIKFLISLTASIVFCFSYFFFIFFFSSDLKMDCVDMKEKWNFWVSLMSRMRPLLDSLLRQSKIYFV